MTNLIKFEALDDAAIRVNEDGRYSIFDVIRLCGCSSERKVWERLTERYPEVVAKCHNFKFQGRGQRETPVTDREGILYIIGLLPGTAGRAYREAAAKVFLAYLDASPELAESVIDRAKPEDLDRIQKRLLGKGVRIRFVSELHDRGVVEGWQIGDCTNAIYQPLLGGTAKMVKQQRNLPARANLRDNLSTLELAATMLAEEIATRDMASQDAKGFHQCKSVTRNAAAKVRKALD